MGCAALSFVFISRHFLRVEEIAETPVDVTGISPSGESEWWVPGDCVVDGATGKAPFVARLKHLRVERLEAEILHRSNGRVLVRSAILKPSDLLIHSPDTVPADQAVSIRGGLPGEEVIRLTLEAGIAAGMAKNLSESLRFLPGNYQDNNRFDYTIMGRFLERAFKEFDAPRIELAEAPVIQLKGKAALVWAEVRLEASYRGRRNYLIGDTGAPNSILVQMEKSGFSWKVTDVGGLSPLGFQGNFLRLMGADVGLPLSQEEHRQKKEACMPCRERMSERFGSRP